MGANDIVHI